MKCAKCEICEQKFAIDELFPMEAVRHSVLVSAQKHHPHLDTGGYICPKDLRQLRTHHIECLLEKERGDLSKLEKDVLKSIKEHDVLTRNINKRFDKGLTWGQKLADQIAHFGGSWTFIISFLLFITVWMAINTVFWFSDSFDPYPFILLNLFLSCLAALQAPVIMMSQNRQAAKERMRSDYEYSINLKAELEIRQLHSKMDQFTRNQWERHLEFQQMQIDLAEEMLQIGRGEAPSNSEPKSHPPKKSTKKTPKKP